MLKRPRYYNTTCQLKNSITNNQKEFQSPLDNQAFLDDKQNLSWLLTIVILKGGHAKQISNFF